MKEALIESIANNLWNWRRADKDVPDWAREITWQNLVKLHDDKAFYDAERLVRILRWQAKTIAEWFIIEPDGTLIAHDLLCRRLGLDK